MGLIADIVESFKAAFGGIAEGSKKVGQSIQDDLQVIADATTAAGSYFWEEGVLDIPQDIRDTANFIKNPLPVVLGSATALAGNWIEGWTIMLFAALDRLNVDAPQDTERRFRGIAREIERELASGSEDAKERIATVVAVVNFVVVTGNAASIAAELASAGMVKSIAEAIQSWIWANGLGGMTSLAFSPQINASVGPLLDRHFNERAQAKLPGPGDMVRFQLREVFLAERRDELVGEEDREVFDAYMRQLGFSKFWADSYWGAHWVLPSISQLNEMLFRGVIDQDEWTRFVRFNDFEPSQIPNLQEIIFNPYTRVDVRRMHRMGILTDLELLQAYADLGNFAPTSRGADGRLRATFVPVPDFTVHKAQALVIFTKVFNALPELRARFRRGWISRDELLRDLVATGIPADKARTLWQTIVDADLRARTAPERELTRGLIARAWKLQLISFPQGVFLLERIGWDTPEAELILRVQSEPDFPGADLGTALGLRLTGGIEQFDLAIEEEAT